MLHNVLAKPFFGEGRLQDEHRDQGGSFTWVCLANGSPEVSTYAALTSLGHAHVN